MAYIQNIGGFASPSGLVVTYADGQPAYVTTKPDGDVWMTNQKATAVTLPGNKKVTFAITKGGIFMRMKATVAEKADGDLGRFWE